jgi:hypothetical protein
LSQPDMEREMVSPPAGAYITLFTIYHVLPDLPEEPGTTTTNRGTTSTVLQNVDMNATTWHYDTLV